ncbi:hypothetical protein [Rubrivivax gelatinosus]|uniref:CopL family metal-binding regulatory protein n=1 Tax=Rubrivivax gelatinosus TaxID=28068 RepID=A0A4R2LX52_RUBGE|nr:hypothetical protein [Rubrivivax gelatinosus]MBK1690072.1 hypothetical protein [Rubrivivax gelatinosus]TCO96914.1 hypothetical protein EV684_1259 [Rubrivivax gelatinosus]
MKALRVWMFVLLAALLPLRGVAAPGPTMPASPCAPAAAAPHDMAAMAEHTPATACCGDEHPGGCGHDTGGLCAAHCAAVPLAGTAATLVIAAPESGDAVFPPAPTPRAGHVPDGLERPPRAA